MHALFFEVTPKTGHEDHYFRRAAALKPLVERNDGLAFLDRYRSLSRADTILSYQLWRDDEALGQWRADTKHHLAQKAGRETHFADYRLRVCRLVQWFDRTKGDVDADVRDEPLDSGVEQTRFVLGIESAGQAFVRGEPFKSVNRDGAYVSVLHVAEMEEGREILNDAFSQGFVTAARLCHVLRDYGMYDRTEAPQEFPPVEMVVS